MDAPPPSSSDVRSALLDAVDLVASAAIVLTDIAEGCLEAIEVRHRGAGRFGIFAELDELGFEVGHVLPDLRVGGGIATGLRSIREQRRHLRRRVLERHENLLRRGEIERRLALGHGGADLGLIAVGLHQRPARGDRVLLGHGDGHAKCNGSHGEHGTNHVVVSL